MVASWHVVNFMGNLSRPREGVSGHVGTSLFKKSLKKAKYACFGAFWGAYWGRDWLIFCSPSYFLGVSEYIGSRVFWYSDVGHFGEGLHDIKNQLSFSGFSLRDLGRDDFLIHVFASNRFFSTEIAFTHPPAKVGFGKQEKQGRGKTHNSTWFQFAFFCNPGYTHYPYEV